MAGRPAAQKMEKVVCKKKTSFSTKKTKDLFVVFLFF